MVLATDPEDALRQLIRAMVEKMLQPPGDQTNLRYRLMLHEVTQPSTAIATVMQESKRHRRLQQRLEAENKLLRAEGRPAMIADSLSVSSRADLSK